MIGTMRPVIAACSLALLVGGCRQIFGIDDPTHARLDGAPADGALCYGAPFQICLESVPTQPFNLSEGTLDTDGSQDCLPFTSAQIASACVLAGTTINGPFGAMRAVGSKPLVLVATDSITVNLGTELEVSSDHTLQGAASDPNDCLAAPGSGNGGGAGGSFGSRGADGGMDGVGSSVSTSFPYPAPDTLHGGCEGVPGGGGASGGNGGGAILVVSSQLTIHGEINASGEGGAGGHAGGGGGGGGAGGMIVLEAMTVTIDGHVFANGAGGGEGGAASDGNDGQQSIAGNRASGGAGGATNGGNGGDGGFGATAAGSGQDGTASGGGGGGGGGVGVIQIHAVSYAITSPGLVSPSPS
jgi:hypothetical protein